MTLLTTIVFTRAQVAKILEIDERTIYRYLENYSTELTKNGYSILAGPKLLKFKKIFLGTDIDVSTKTTQLDIFNFRALLNLAMLLKESEKACQIRSRILDIVIDVIAKRTGGHTKYINQRDEGYLLSDFQQKTYRKSYVTALENYVENFKFKLQTYINKIYKAIFQENATEYRKILNLAGTENVRDTMYSEVLDLISSIENGLAHEIKKTLRS